MAGRTVSLFLVARDRLSKTFNKAAASATVLEKRLKTLQKVSLGVSGIGALTQGVTALGAAAVPAAGAVAALPGALLSVKAVTSTLKMGLHGVSEALDALANNDGEKFEKAMAKMTPSAQAFVKEAAKFNEALSPIRTAVQEALFKDLDDQLRSVAEAQLPGVTKGMTTLASTFNLIAREAGEYFKTAHAQDSVNKVFESTDRIMTRLAAATQTILRGVMDLAVKGLPFTEQLGAWAIDGMRTASVFFSSERGAKALATTIDNAKEAFSSLGGIVRNVGAILRGVLQNSNMDGNDVLNVLERLTGQAAAWVKSTEGQEKITSFFTLLQKTLQDLGPALMVMALPLTMLGNLLMSLEGPTQDVAAKILAFGLAAALLGPKLGLVFKVLGFVTVGLGKFIFGLVKGTAALTAKSAAATRAGAAVRGFAVAVGTAVGAAWRWTAALLASAVAKGKVAAQAALATTRTIAMTVAQKASAAASKAMAAATWLVNAAMRANPIGIVITILTALVGAIVLAYNKSETFRKIVQAAWQGIQTAVSFAWNNVLKPLLGLWVAYIKNIVIPAILYLWKNVVSPAFKTIGSIVKSVWTGFVQPAFKAIQSGVKAVGSSFSTAASTIGKVWKKVEGYAKAPIKFVIQTVLNNGLLAAWNKVAKQFGLKPDNLAIPLPKGFAKGGILPGYSRKDDQLIMARSGEGILVPEAVKSLGERFIHRANALKGDAGKLLGGFGDPGGLGIPGFAGGGIVGGIASFLGSAKNWFLDGITNAAKFVTEPILNAIESSMAAPPFAKMLAGIPRKMVSGFLGWIGGAKNPLATASGGPGVGGKAVAAARSQIGVPYSWGGGGPGGPGYGFAQGAGIKGFDCSSLMQYAWYQATGKVIPRTTYTQMPWVKKIGKPVPGALGFPNSGHVFMASNKPGQIIEAPYTGARVRETAMRNAWWGLPPWVMDTGGTLRPGMNPPIFNGTGGNEYVLRPDQIAAIAGGGGVLEVVPGGQGEFEQFMANWVRKWVRVKGGGNVQKAFGTRG